MQHFRFGQFAANLSQAVAAFAVAYSMLQFAAVTDYAVLSFILVIQAFGIALVQAMIGAPLLILLNRAHKDPNEQAIVLGYILVAIAVALIVALTQSAIVLVHTQTGTAGMLLAVASFLQVLRFALRSYWLNRQPAAVIRSDFLQSLIVLVTLGWMLLSAQLTLVTAASLLVLANALAIWPLRLRGLFQSNWAPDWAGVAQGWQRQGKPALLGVLTVELTANFHCYFVMLMAGSQAFAAIAAATLYLRPQAVVLQSLQQSDRVRLVQAWQGARQTIRQLLASMHKWIGMAFVLNLLAVTLLCMWQPGWLWPEAMSFEHFVLALVLWALLSALRGARLPASLMLQAADQFRPLAQASYISAAVTVPAVCISYLLGGAVMSLIGVLVGEIVLAGLVRQKTLQLLRSG